MSFSRGNDINKYERIKTHDPFSSDLSKSTRLVMSESTLRFRSGNELPKIRFQYCYRMTDDSGESIWKPTAFEIAKSEWPRFKQSIAEFEKHTSMH